ncbi:D-amino acid aminotransferase [Thalassotalea sp. ND16A]|uniref:D-amino acid aminotransferase n=1 Tax=Thalassotalea sp. ND16A TaxID=1535422 RepID=UPI00051A0EEF|nr:D-amino acid aminotransferase [Thalassotalea sp. ND16A]KGJ97192.1 D-amino-acid transaminase [Thalassotalea sp. ND16A]
MTDIVYLNGDLVAKDSAKISVLDRGFLFADGVYEVIPVYNSTPFRLKQHLSRLNACLMQLDIANPHSAIEWKNIIATLIQRNGGGHLAIYLQVTRGVSKERNHLLDANMTPTVLLMASKLTVAEQNIQSITATLLNDIRWLHCDIKSIALLGNIMLSNKARQSGHDEAILHRDGLVTEGAASNVFMVKHRELFTPPQNQLILGGITRDVIIELAEASGLKVHQQDIHIDQLLSADEVWISSSAREISPIRQIDDKIIGSGIIGPVASVLHSEFQAFKKTLIN